MVASAGSVTDWRSYVRLYPWAVCGAAFAAGYLIVPKRRKIVVQVPPELGRTVEPAAPEPKKERAGLIGGLWGLVGPLALRAAQAYAASLVEQWLVQQNAPGPASMPEHESPGGEPRPSRSPRRQGPP
jgi:hypothetical protein